MASTLETYLTVAEAADALHVAQSTIRRWIREGRLPAYRIGPRRVALREQDVAGLVEPFSNATALPETEYTDDQRTRPRTLGESIEHLDRLLRRTSGMNEDSGEIRDRRLTPEEKRRALEALELAGANAARIAAKYGSNWTPSTLELIHEGREERTRQLMNDCD